MSQDRKNIGVMTRIFLSLLIGAVAGYLLRAAMDRPVSVPAEASCVVSVPSVIVTNSIDDTKANEVIGYLRSRVETLEKQLAVSLSEKETAAKTAVVEPKASELASRDVVAKSGQTRSDRRREYFERMKKEEPERYAELRKRMEDFRKHMQEVSADRQDFFASIDTSRMTDGQRASHKLLLEATAKIDSYRSRFAPDSPNPLTEEERRDYFETRHALGDLLESDRRYILEALGADYGEDGEVFADYIEAVFEYTSPRGFGRRAKGGRR